MYIDKKLIYEKTEGGRTIIEKYYPDSAQSFNQPKRKFKIREERDASASLKMINGCWVVTDFGGDRESRDCIGIVEHEENCTWPEALKIINANFNITGSEVKAVEVLKPVMAYRDATPDEVEGEYIFDVKEDFTIAEVKTIVAAEVWKHLEGQIDKYAEQAAKEAHAFKIANEVFKRYHFHSLNSYTIIKNRKATTITATDSFPLFMFDEGKWQKIYQPKAEKKYRFTYYGGGEKVKIPTDFIFGYQQAAKAYQELVAIPDDEAMLEEDKTKKEKKKPKLSEIILCSGGSDALNIALLGYQVVWMNSETAKLHEGQFKNLSMMSHRVYNIPDIDKTGINAAHELGMKHLDIYTLYLPDELRTHTDWRKNPCKDVRDYFKYYNVFEFRELFKIAYPYRFWDLKKEYNKAGEYTGTRYVPNTLYIYSFLRGNGFYRFKVDTEAEKYIYVHIVNNIVSEVTVKDIRDFINNFLEERHMEPELRNAFFRTTQLNESSLSNIKHTQIDFSDFDATSQWMFFKNKVLKVTAEKIEAIRPENCDKLIWEQEVLPHKVDVLSDFFTITRNEAKEWDIKINNKDCLVFRFLINASRIFWREELEHRAEGLASDERERYIEAQGFTKEEHALANGLIETDELTKQQVIDKYRLDNKWEIAGPLLTAAEKLEQKHHLINKIYGIGYLMHRHKSRARAWCYWAMDNKITDGADSNGGSGKSLILTLISHFMQTEHIPGRDDKITEDKHIFGNLTPHHDLIFVDDCSQYLKFDFFYPAITGGISCNPKHGKKTTIGFPDAGKLAFASNYPPYGVDLSAERRILYGLFGDYYHANQYDEYREERRVSDDFGGKILGDDFSEEEWNLCCNFFAQCIKFYMATDVKINPPMDNVNKRNLKATMSDVFQSWADVYFSAEADHLDKRIVRKEAFEDFRKTTKQMNWSAPRFKKSLAAWCRYNNCELNPKEQWTDEKNKRIIQKVKTTNERNETVESTEEMLYIKSAQLDLFEATEAEVVTNPADEDLPF